MNLKYASMFLLNLLTNSAFAMLPEKEEGEVEEGEHWEREVWLSERQNEAFVRQTEREEIAQSSDDQSNVVLEFDEEIQKIVQGTKRKLENDYPEVIAPRKKRKYAKNAPEIKDDHNDTLFNFETPRYVDLYSPLKNKITRFEESGREVNIIFRSETEYTDVLWGYVNPLCKESYLIFDASKKEYNELAEEFLADLSVDQKSSDLEFFAEALRFVHEKIEILDGLCIKPKNDNEIVCRHYSVSPLPFFYKLLNHKDSPFKGNIRLFHCPYVDNNGKTTDFGHAWNVITIVDADSKSHLHYDILNGILCEIDAKYMKDLIIYHLSSDDMSGTSITEAFNSLVYKAVRISREFFGIRSGKNLFGHKDVNEEDEEKLHEEAALKFFFLNNSH